jgi:hypothetical protein
MTISTERRHDVLESTTVRPGDVVLLGGTYQVVGELYDAGADVQQIFKYGPAVLTTSSRRSYAEIEEMKVASSIPHDHPARTKADYNTWVRYETALALHDGVVTR